MASHNVTHGFRRRVTLVLVVAHSDDASPAVPPSFLTQIR
jgi:hypothetical protein